MLVARVFATASAAANGGRPSRQAGRDKGASREEQAASGVEAAQVSAVSLEDAPYGSSLQDQVGRRHVPRLGDQCQHDGR
jgi:hypothetical protein